ncbi:MAG: MBL fold metallo-hydrolase [Lachnospiraceae bacterium]|nr:MBL fold metallo-hydrolase [Lachnospiraceae bacterium]
MRIVNLIENTEGVNGCAYAHGLAFYIETENHKLLVDLGPSEETLSNAEKLGIDLSGIDTVILSHGHYDHSGGIMPFLSMNKKARIYMQQTAGKDYYADDGDRAEGDRYVYIGIDKRIMDSPRVEYVNGDHRIDDELELFTIKNRNHEIPFTNKRLLVREGSGYKRDSFEHEQYLVINNGDRRILVSGCAHNGVLNIMEAYFEKYNSAPYMVISGFHLMKKTDYTESEIREIEDMAKRLKEYPTRFITCHCTGKEPYEIMKKVMGEKLEYVHSGEEIPLDR